MVQRLKPIQSSRAVVYIPTYNERRATLMRAFAEGIPNADVRPLGKYQPSDIAVVFGLYKQSYDATEPLREIMERHSGRSLVVVDDGFVCRGEYWSVGLGGILRTAHYGVDSASAKSDRWSRLRVRLRPWRLMPEGPIIIAGQIPWDVAVQDSDHVGWCQRSISFFRRRGEWVEFRPPPGLANWKRYFPDFGPEVGIDTRDLATTLDIAQCVVSYNSNVAVDAVISGVPSIACHPSSMAWSMSVPELKQIQALRQPGRRAWLAALGYSQWTAAEMRAGMPWRHLFGGSNA